MDDLLGMLTSTTAAPGGAPAVPAPAATLTGLASAIGGQGGLDPMLDKLRAAGYDQQVDSWISTGDNQTIPPQQLGSALGDDTVEQLSAHSGISVAQLLPLLAMFLPTIVNMLTPKGQAPAGGVNQAAANAGPDLGGLLGGILGGAGGGTGGASGQDLPDLGGLLGGLLGGKGQR